MKLNHFKFKTFARTIPRDEVATALGITRQTWNNRLNNLGSPDNDFFKVTEFLAICEMLQMNPSEFIEKEGE